MSKAEGQQRTTQEVASDYNGRGWAVIPIARGTKIPRGVAWQETTVEDFKPSKFGGRKNIGVVLGDNSGRLIDIDLDHQLAVDLADKFLPTTASEFGRVGKPRSHRLYRVTASVDTHKRKLPGKGEDGAMVVELRSTGAQTVFPGSLHTSGELIEWHSDGEPLEIDPAELKAAVDALADEVEALLGVPRDEPGGDRKSNGQSDHLIGGQLRHSDGVSGEHCIDVADRARRYVATMPHSISGSGGHNALLTVTMRLWRDFALDKETVLSILREEFNPRCEPAWSEKELLHKVDEAEKLGGERGKFLTTEPATCKTSKATSSSSASPVSQEQAIAAVAGSVVANAVKTSGESSEIFPIKTSQIIERLQKQTGNWPRAANGLLFVDEPSALLPLEKTTDLFAYFHRAVGAVTWHKGPSCIDKGEFHSALQQSVPRYLAIEECPHFPPIAGHYYRERNVKPGDGKALDALLDRFCPETDIDRDLLLAALATTFWGGAPGKRPGFAITSQHGRGTGKTTVPTIFGALAGGMFDVSLGEDIAALKHRLLTPEALTKRVVLLDNIKTSRMSWAEVESLITAAEISGKRLYSGEATRPNVITWMLTLNGISLAKDLAQRFVVIKLAKWKKPPMVEGESVPSWDEDTAALLADRRWDIIADIAAFFQREPARLRDCSRWGSWERAVLARLPEPEEAQLVIAERQAEVDADDEEAGDIEEFFAKQLTELNYDPKRDRVHIPVLTATIWYEAATNSPANRTTVTRIIKQAAAEGTLQRIRLNPCRSHGRGFLWIGEDASDSPHYDLADRIRQAEGDAALNRRAWN